MITPVIIAIVSLGQPSPLPPAAAGDAAAAAILVEPTGPLTRVEPLRHRFTFATTINYEPAAGRANPWQLPLIINGPWSKADATAFGASLTAGRETQQAATAKAVDAPGPLGETVVALPVPPITNWPLTVSITGVTTSWSSRLDDDAAMQLDWPSTWPAALAAVRKPGVLIESDAPIIRDAVQSLTEGQVRSVPPIQAAKLIIQYACTHFKVGQTRVSRGQQGQLRGIDVRGAKQAATSGEGSPADLVCLCVAMLRAADLPARPVIGIGSLAWGGADEFGVWGEVFLPGCGWTPFDPRMLSEQSIATLDARRPWEYFGTMPRLNRAIPIAWSFAPGDGSDSFDSWAVWGWTRFLPNAAFPVPIEHDSIVTSKGRFTLNPQRPVPSCVTLTRTSAP